MKRYTLLILTFLLYTFGCGNQKPSNVDLLITNASIVDVQNDTVLTDKSIPISGKRIIAVDEDSNRNQYHSEEIINIKGQYLMPGLWDMHVHFMGGDTLATENKKLLPLFLAFGVTTVRDAGGDITPAIKEWQLQIKNRELAGPTIYTSGPKLDDFSSPGFIQVKNKLDIEQGLDSLESIGVDYVKLYNYHLNKEVYYGIIKEAEQRGLKTTGHVPHSANLLQAAKYGLDGVEHLHHLMKPTSALADSLIRYRLGLNYFFQFIESYDRNLARKAYGKLAKHKFYVTSTLHYLKKLTQIQGTDHSTDTLLSYIGPGIRKSYQASGRLTKSSDEQYAHEVNRMTNRLISMVEPMHHAGINLLTGTDSGPTSPYLFPGQSIHEELKLLVEAAGLTPAEALHSSVINGPKFFDHLDSYGSIEKGKMADLVILTKNPLQNIKHTTSVQSVVSRGQFYSEKELSRMISPLKN